MASLSRKQKRLQEKKQKKNSKSKAVTEQINQALNSALQLHKAGNLQKAGEIYQNILQVDPNNSNALHLLGSLCYQTGQNEQAIALLGKAVEIKSNEPAYYNNLGNAFVAIGNYDSAISMYKKALALKNPYPEATINIGAVLSQMGKYEEEVSYYNECLKKSPESFQILNELIKAMNVACLWDGLDKHIKKLIDVTNKVINQNLLPPLTPYHSLTLPASPEFKKKVAENYASKKFGRIQPAFEHNPVKKEKLRIGYVSADFRDHPTAHLINGLLKGHNRNEFEVYAYSLSPDDGSEYRKNIEESADVFTNVFNMPLTHIAQQIYNDKIDILLDVMGYIQNATTEIFALRPAPVQVNFLAYPGTMGASFIDYLVTDNVAVPKGSEGNYTEKLIFMPNSYFATDNKQKIGKVLSRKEYGLPEDKFVFCCFNKSSKIDERVFKIWMDILKEKEDSVLWLLSDNEFVRANLREQAKENGVDADRLIFAGRMAKEDHLARHACADIFLDCFTVNAHTTAIDSLWAGLPVITMPGDDIISRASASIVSACDLPELIAKNETEYKKLALKYANDGCELKKLKAKLAANLKTAPLFDTELYVKNFEKSLKDIWDY